MDSRITHAKIAYGLTNDLFVDWKTGDETVLVGGRSGASRWSQRLTRQAAYQLWSNLTRLLFPEKAKHVLGLAKTAPLCEAIPTLTSRFEIVRNTDLHVLEILGWVGEETWWCRVDYQNARNLWAALDLALYPAGWSGPVTHHRKLN